MGSNSISGLPDPSNADDVATKNYVDSLTSGLKWRRSVIYFSASAPSGATVGDRYIATADWGMGNVANDVMTLDSTDPVDDWSSHTPVENDARFATTPSNAYVFNGTAWAQFKSGVATDGVDTTNIKNGAVTAAKLNDMSATTGQVLVYNGSAWAPAPTTNGTVTSVTATTPLTGGTFTTTGSIGINQASSSQDGYLSALDFTTFFTAAGYGNHASAGYLKADGSVTASAALNMDGNVITNLSDPTDGTDAATKGYVDGRGLRWRRPVIGLSASAPLGATLGDRYIATADWVGDGSNAANDVMLLESSGPDVWTPDTPDDNDARFASGSSNTYVFNDNAWVAQLRTTTFATLPVTGTTITSSGSTYSGASITLGPGKWAVNLALTLNNVDNVTTSYSIYFALSSSDSIYTQIVSPEVLGANKIFAKHPSNLPSSVNGTLYVNNTSGAAKTYYLWVDSVVGTFGAGITSLGGSDLPENQLVAVPVP
jgi:hypothetical protein